MGLLSFGTRLTGYELRQWALGSTRFFWAAPAMSQIYREVERLSAAGLVNERDESGDSDRARTTFGLTDAGATELRRWVNEAPFEPPTLRHPTAFRLFLGHVGDRDRLIELLEAQREWADELLADLRVVDADLAGDQRFKFARSVAAWGIEYYGAEVDATGAALDRLLHDR